jgi:hypothetical protein
VPKHFSYAEKRGRRKNAMTISSSKIAVLGLAATLATAAANAAEIKVYQFRRRQGRA